MAEIMIKAYVSHFALAGSVLFPAATEDTRKPLIQCNRATPLGLSRLTPCYQCAARLVRCDARRLNRLDARLWVVE